MVLKSRDSSVSIKSVFFNWESLGSLRKEVLNFW